MGVSLLELEEPDQVFQEYFQFEESIAFVNKLYSSNFYNNFKKSEKNG